MKTSWRILKLRKAVFKMKIITIVHNILIIALQIEKLNKQLEDIHRNVKEKNKE